MDLREISDRLEINNLLIDYCTAIDAHDWDALDAVFTPDAHIDYTALGGIKGSFPEIKAYLAKVLPFFPSTQHLIANSRVWLDGDTARARTMCHNPMEMPLKAGGTQVAFYGLWYVDRLVRTPAGWRIRERVEERGYAYNVPAEFLPFSE
jgi:hypothetical protein